MNTRQILSIAAANIMFIVILVLATFYQSAQGVVKLSGEQVQLTNEQDVRLTILEQQLEQDNNYRLAQLDALNTQQQLETLEMALHHH